MTVPLPEPDCRLPMDGPPRYRADQLREYAAAVSAADNAALLMHQKAAPLCDKHKPTGGSRSVCLICAIRAQQDCLSRISYACGEPNEMEVSSYDWHGDEESVVDQVKALQAWVKVLEDELRNIAQANPSKWEIDDPIDRLRQFKEWAQNRARAALGSQP